MSGSTHGLIIMKNLKYIISAAAVAFLVYIFTFYLDGEMGVILLAFVLFAPLVSFGFAYYAKKNVTVSIFPSATTDTLTFIAHDSHDGFQYRCIVHFEDGTTAVSDPAKITVKSY